MAFTKHPARCAAASSTSRGAKIAMSRSVGALAATKKRWPSCFYATTVFTVEGHKAVSCLQPAISLAIKRSGETAALAFKKTLIMTSSAANLIKH